jgi:hypothetical protein
VEPSDGTGVDAREGAGDELMDAGDGVGVVDVDVSGVGVVDVDVSAPAFFTVTLKSASFW